MYLQVALSNCYVCVLLVGEDLAEVYLEHLTLPLHKHTDSYSYIGWLHRTVLYLAVIES